MLIPISSSAARVSRRIARLARNGSGRLDPLAAQEHVLEDRQLVDQREVLVDGVDAERARMVDAPRLVRLAAEEQAALVGLLEAADDLHQRRLAGAVVAEQPQHLALAQVQAEVAQRDDGPEALRDVLDAQHVVRRAAGRDDALAGDA